MPLKLGHKKIYQVLISTVVSYRNYSDVVSSLTTTLKALAITLSQVLKQLIG